LLAKSFLQYYDSWQVYKKVLAHQAISESNSAKTTTPFFVFFATKCNHDEKEMGKEGLNNIFTKLVLSVYHP
jgi:hypothetical protein